MENSAVVFEDVWKSYPSYNQVTGGIKGFLLHLPQAIRELRTRHSALEGLNLEIKKGERFGFIGRNGAGKSTTLGLIAGVLSADRGSVQVNGRVSPLLALGAGFHPELTGRENILLNGILMGLTRQEVSAHLEEIIEFSELREFIDQPVRTYSSGMYVKLGFSVVSQLKPEILLLDEVFAVGDAAFKSKCQTVFDSFRNNKDITIILVSHSVDTVQTMCDRVAWIEDKKIKMIGEAKEVVTAYLKAINPRKTIQTGLPLHVGFGCVALDIKQACADFDVTTSEEGCTARLALWQRGVEHPLQQWSNVPQSVSLVYENATFTLRDVEGNILSPQSENVVFTGGDDEPLLLSAQCEREGQLEGSLTWLPYLYTPNAAVTHRKEAQHYWREKAGEGLPPFVWASGRVIHFVARNIMVNDAVGNCVMQMVATLRKCNIPCRVYAYASSPELAGYVSPIADLWNAIQAGDTLFYHYSTEDEFLPELVTLHCKTKILYYHNVTPGHWFREHMPEFADALDKTEEQYTYFSDFNAVIANSTFSLQNILPYLAEKTPKRVFPPTMKPKKLHLLTPSPLSLPKAKYTILWVGRVAPHKRPELALEIMQKLAVLCDDVALMMVISGRNDMPFMAERLEKARQQLSSDMQSKIHFYEGISDAELAYLYKNASLFLCTSGHEGYCLPVSEAVSLGVKVACFPQEAVEETLAGRGIVLPENVEEAVREIYNILMG